MAWLLIVSAFVAALLKLCYCSKILILQPSDFPPAQEVQRADGLCQALVNIYNYNCKEYVVRTEDDFLLGVQRISSPRVQVSKGPVLLLHGVLIGGDIWVLNLPHQSLPFILADEGYEVWIGNVRTTTFSYGHVRYKRKDKGFWDWSVDELAKYDLKSMLEHVYACSGKKVYYIGYSEGTQAGFAAFSQGKLLEFVEKAVMIAPIAYLQHITSPIALAAAAIHLDTIYDTLHIYEFSLTYRSYTGKEIVDYLCPEDNNYCYKNVIALLTGKNCCMNVTRRAVYDKYELQDTATKNMNHFAQRKFRMFDYGFFSNMMHYGSPNPPTYELSKISSQLPMMLVSGGQDALSDPTDVKRLIPELNCNPLHIHIPEYAHFDFVLGTNAKELLYDKLINFIQSN